MVAVAPGSGRPRGGGWRCLGRRWGFVGEAEVLPPDTPTSNTTYPWDAGRADVLKSFNLRLPEPILFQLRYIGEYTPYSMQQFCIEHLTVAIQEKIAELTGEK